MSQNQQMQKQMQQLMSTQEGKALLSILSNNPEKLKQAAMAIKSGNQEKAQEIMGPLMEEKQVKDLLSVLNQKLGNG